MLLDEIVDAFIEEQEGRQLLNEPARSVIIGRLDERVMIIG